MAIWSPGKSWQRYFDWWWQSFVGVTGAAAMGLPVGSAMEIHAWAKETAAPTQEQDPSRALTATKGLICTMLEEWSTEYTENSVMPHFLAPTTVAMATAWLWIWHSCKTCSQLHVFKKTIVHLIMIKGVWVLGLI